MPAPILERFEARVRRTDSCWLWIGSLDRLGYGRFYDAGRYLRAHRVAYELFVGPIPEGLEIDHVHERGCRNRNCVNPDHLEAVDHGENVRRGSRGRQTHCKNGHPFNDKNTYTRPNGNRRCRRCNSEAQRRRQMRMVNEG